MRVVLRQSTALVVLTGLLSAGGIVTLRGQTPPRRKLLFLTHAALYQHPNFAPAGFDPSVHNVPVVSGLSRT